MHLHVELEPNLSIFKQFTDHSNFSIYLFLQLLFHKTVNKTIHFYFLPVNHY